MNKLQTVLLIVIIITTSFLLIQNLQTKQKEVPKSTITITTQALSSEEYKNTKNELIEHMKQKNPRVALETLREKMKSNQAITRSCHDLVHEIGHAAYEKYDDFGQAMQYQDELCNSGYLHGIIENHFSKSNDIFTTMNTVCNQYSPKSFIGWECLHGVGHGLMYFTENNLPKSISFCEEYADIFSRQTCINGVFMENFNVDQKLHVSKYLDANNPMSPCTQQKPKYKTDCYLYAPTYFLSLHKNEYLDALQWCKTAEDEFQLTCATGVGSQAIKENIANPKFVESLCMQGSRDATNACIAGMVGLYINHFGGLNEAKMLCTKLEKTNQKICEQTIVSQQTLF